MTFGTIQDVMQHTMQHTCNMYATRMQHTSNMYAPCMQHATYMQHATPIPNRMLNITYSVHATYMRYSSTYIFMLHTCNICIHATYMLHTRNIHATYMQHILPHRYITVMDVPWSILNDGWSSIPVPRSVHRPEQYGADGAAAVQQACR